MIAFAKSKERTYDLLDKGMKKKGSGYKAKKNTKVRQKRKFRALTKRELLKEAM